MDNFIKGVFDGLSRPKKALIHPEFEVHEKFDLPENYDIHPERFTVIEDDGEIVEIRARIIKDSEYLFYKIRIEGRSDEKNKI